MGKSQSTVAAEGQKFLIYIRGGKKSELKRLIKKKKHRHTRILSQSWLLVLLTVESVNQDVQFLVDNRPKILVLG